MSRAPCDCCEYQWGVVFEGRNLGWIAYSSRAEAETEALRVEDKYAPAYVARRMMGPVQKVGEDV